MGIRLPAAHNNQKKTGNTMRIKKLLTVFLFLCTVPISLSAQDYYMYVAAESEDQVHLVHFNADTKKAVISETIHVGSYPTEIDGPHGVTVSPDGEHWFVSIAHGNPFGSLAKYDTETNEMVGTTELGLFPATMEISPVNGLLYVVNFNLHGEMEPSTVMVVDPENMEVITEIEAGIMPHGTRINSAGDRGYHVSMMTDELIEVNTDMLTIERRLKLGQDTSRDHESMGHSAMGHEDMMHMPVEKPTWADPHPTKPMVYIAGNGSDEILEVNTDEWEVTRRFETGKAPYNLEVSPDGKLLVVTYKGEGATAIWDISSGTELAKVQNSRKVSHGVAISPDSKYAFVTIEGIGGEPGSVDVVDLTSYTLVDHVETGKQAGGIYFWKQIN